MHRARVCVRARYAERFVSASSSLEGQDRRKARLWIGLLVWRRLAH